MDKHFNILFIQAKLELFAYVVDEDAHDVPMAKVLNVFLQYVPF